jgi:hypothetical protein
MYFCGTLIQSHASLPDPDVDPAVEAGLPSVHTKNGTSVRQPHIPLARLQNFQTSECCSISITVTDRLNQ